MSRGRPLNCPRCKAPIDTGSGFGMVECTKCGEIVMVSDLPPLTPDSPIKEPEPLAPLDGHHELPLYTSEAEKHFSTNVANLPSNTNASSRTSARATANANSNANVTQSRAAVPKPGMAKGFNPDHIEFGQAPVGEQEIDLNVAEPFGGLEFEQNPQPAITPEAEPAPFISSGKTKTTISPAIDAALESALSSVPVAQILNQSELAVEAPVAAPNAEPAPPLTPVDNFAFSDILQDHHQPGAVAAQNEETVPGTLAGLSDYANQSPTSPGFAGFGGLVYDVYIDGIDTSEMRQDLSECLSDPKLQMDKKLIMSQVKNGQLVLKDLNPVRASVILNQLKHLSFRINWKSHQMVKQAGNSALALLVSAVFIALMMNAMAPTHSWASDWARHEVNLKGYATRINTMQEDIQALIIKKNQNKDPEVRDELLKQIIKQNDDLQKLYKDYKDEQEHIRFEHPEQGDKTERKYRHVKLKTLGELENEVGLDGQLSRIKQKVEKTYPPPEGLPASAPDGSSKTPPPK